MKKTTLMRRSDAKRNHDQLEQPTESVANSELQHHESSESQNTFDPNKKKQKVLDLIDKILGASSNIEHPFDVKQVEEHSLQILQLEEKNSIQMPCRTYKILPTVVASSCYLQFMHTKEQDKAIKMADVKQICNSLNVNPNKVKVFVKLRIPFIKLSEGSSDLFDEKMVL